MGLSLFKSCVLRFSIILGLSFSPLLFAQQNVQRVALVIGNAAYQGSPLANPVNDARAVAARLRRLGFDVTLRENLKTREIGSTYRDFRTKIKPGAVALVFYAGHGLQVKGQNYFPAVDSDIASEEDVPLQSLNLATLLDNMEEAKAGVSLVLLDACRDNPYSRRFRSATRGLAKVEAASGTLIHYATKPGSVAADGDGKNGTYTEALLAQLDSPLPVELMLKQVTNLVVNKTKGKQEPWVEGSLRGDFYFNGKAVAQVTPVQAPSIDPYANERSFWDSVKDSRNTDELKAYVDRFPNGLFLELAQSRLTLLTPSPPVPASALIDPAAEARNYEAAQAQRRLGNYQGAIVALQNFLVQYPKSNLAPRAEYWTADSYFNLRDFMRALASAQTLIQSYPNSMTVPDAILIIASSKLEMGDVIAGKNSLEEILQKFPISEAAGKARRRLAAITVVPPTGVEPLVNLSPPKGDENAQRLYRLATDKNDAAAQVDLGYLYANGTSGLERNDFEAARLFRLSADQGNTLGQINLGSFYENGRGGLGRDEASAVRLYQLAAVQGNAWARDRLKAMEAIRATTNTNIDPWSGDRRASNTVAEDRNIEFKASSQISEQFPDAHVNVSSVNRLVLVTGEVPSVVARGAIEKIGRSVGNVRGIYNELIVTPNSDLSSRTNDTYLTFKIKTRFFDGQKFNANQVKVVTESGAVYLMGLVSRTVADDATEIARQTSGVRKVVRLFEFIN